MNRDNNESQKGFSLVELSVVLAILGLLAGAVLASKSMIHAGELRSILSEYERYSVAAQTFRDKYTQIPGDLNNATSFWGKNATYCNGHSGVATTNGTCNGDGDGFLRSNPGDSADTTQEMFQFWHQLELAGLISGKYSGIAGPCCFFIASIVGTNVPASRYPNGAWSVERHPWAEAGDEITFAVKTDNLFMLGAPINTTQPYGKLLTPEDAWNIDSKLDDGKPGYGKILALYWNNECSSADTGVSANTNLNASYRVTDTRPQCALKFRFAF